MRSPLPAFAARAVSRVSGERVRPGSAPAGSTWLLLGVVLAGLFAMHGLGTHGTHAAHASGAMTGSVPAPPAAGVMGADDALPHAPGGSATGAGMGVSGSHAVHTPAGDAAAAPTGAMSVATDVRPVGPSSDDRVASRLVEGGGVAGLPGVAGLLGLCVAVLSALVAWVLARGRTLRVVALVPRAAAVVGARGPGRDRDPPSLLVLSVHRC
jgi:hypothetical protein